MMKKGKLGIAFPVLAGIAFILAFDRQIAASIIFMGLIFWVEKDTWLHLQVLQSIFLQLTNAVIFQFDHLLHLSDGLPLPSWLHAGQTFLYSLWLIVYFGLALFAVGRVLMGKDAALPLLSGWAHQAIGVSKQAKRPHSAQSYRPYPTGTPFQNMQQPYSNTQPPHPQTAAPPANMEPTVVPPPAPAEVPSVPPQAVASWQCSCGTTSTGRFCSMCGQTYPMSTSTNQIGGQ